MKGLVPFGGPFFSEPVFLFFPGFEGRLHQHCLPNRALGSAKEGVERLVAQLGRRPRWPVGWPRSWRLLRLLVEQRRQVGLRDAHGLGDLDHDALVKTELVALVQLVAVLVVGVSEEVPGLVVDHDAVVEGMEPDEAIVPALLLAPDVVGEETPELGDRRRVLRGHARASRRHGVVFGMHAVDGVTATRRGDWPRRACRESM